MKCLVDVQWELMPVLPLIRTSFLGCEYRLDHKSTENNRPLLIVAQGAKSAKDFTFSGIGTDDPGNSYALGAA